LVLLLPIKGATAASGTPYFTENPGDGYKAWDMSGTFDWMLSQYITFRWEYNRRAAILARQDQWYASADSRPVTVRQQIPGSRIFAKPRTG